MRVLQLGAAVLALSAALGGQARLVRATGEAVISVQPDQVKLDFGVVTTADSARTAAAQNAARADAVLARLKQALGTRGEIRSVNYSLTPNYRPTGGPAPELAGFTATNTLEITSTDLKSVGALIDAAIQAGANNLGGLRFTVANEEPVRAQALAAAAKKARSNAEAIASGLGGHLGAVVKAEQGAEVRPLGVHLMAAAGPATPVEPGLVQVSATVTVEIELI